MKLQMPKGAADIIERLEENGFQAYAVGGCVRDSILGKFPQDWDITTSARPEQVKAVFPRTIDTGIQHGTVTVMVEGTGYEVTTYRIDGEYVDGRHPRSVEFTPDLLEDLKRRDFTINAMAYSDREGLVDAFDGREDLKKGIVRCVGDPVCRFTEDALRILRAVRFSAQLGFSIEKDTRQAAQTLAANLSKVSRERVQVELTKLLLSDHPEKIRLVYDMGLAPYITEGFCQARERCLVNLDRLSKTAPEKHVRWAAFLRFEKPELAAGILRDLKMDNDTIDKVKTLIFAAKEKLRPEKPEIRRVMSRLSSKLYQDLLDIWEIYGREEERERLRQIRRLSEQIIEDGDCICLKNLAVSGKDLIEAGRKPGPELGKTLNYLFQLVLDHPEYNTKEYLMKAVGDER